MVTDIAIWDAPPSVRYGGGGLPARPTDLSGHSAHDDFTDADYVPVRTYLKPVRTVIRAAPAATEIVATVNEGSGIDIGRGRSAIQLYTSIFNYREPPAPRLYVCV